LRIAAGISEIASVPVSWIGRDAAYSVLYAGNQGLALLTTVLLIRYGQHSLGLAWVIGAILTLGWGTTLYGMFGPTLSARIWSEPRWPCLVGCTQALVLAWGVVAAIWLWPASEPVLSDIAGLSISWLSVFVALGLFRAYAQVLSTLSVRHGQHARVLRFQLVGRTVEIFLALLVGLGGTDWILLLAWAAYPLAQVTLLAIEWREYKDTPLDRVKTADNGRAWIVAMIGQGFDLVVPTVWLRFGGAEIFVAYRLMTAAISNSVMLPRYWYVLRVEKVRDGGVNIELQLAVIGVALAMSAVFQIGSNAVAWPLFAWSMLPVIINGAVMPYFSRLRQMCLNQGLLNQPILAIIAGRLAELMALMLFVLAGVASEVSILAYAGFALCAPVLHLLYRRIA
jgi:hypothetical protein